MFTSTVWLVRVASRRRLEISPSCSRSLSFADESVMPAYLSASDLIAFSSSLLIVPADDSTVSTSLVSIFPSCATRANVLLMSLTPIWLPPVGAFCRAAATRSMS